MEKISKYLANLLESTQDHHVACGCGPCLALSGWTKKDETDALKQERKEKP